MQTKKHTRSHVPVRQILDSLGLGGLSGHCSSWRKRIFILQARERIEINTLTFLLKDFIKFM